MLNKTKKQKMELGEIEAMLITIHNIRCKLEEAAGPMLACELLMRLIGELSEAVRNKLKEKEDEHKKKGSHGRRDCSYEYKDCNLSLLDEAIIDVFSNILTAEECEKLKKFRQVRNKLMHADFINLMVLLGIAPVGREINPRLGTRNILEDGDIKEAVISIDRNQGFAEARRLAEEAISILEKIIRSFLPVPEGSH